MKIHVVNSANRHLYGAELEDFFRARHRIYVEEKEWREDDGSGFEIDQFDTEDATYLIGIEGDEVMTGTRLVPTSLPHMLSEIFPHLCDFAGVIRADNVAEWTRGFIVPEYRERGIGPVKGQFCGTVMEYCLNEGIQRIGGIQDLYWLPVWRRYKWTVRQVGNPAQVDGRWCVAAFFDVCQDARDRALSAGGIHDSILVHRGPYEPFLHGVESRRAKGGRNAA
jgi:acyl-homoserine lactone synthase